MDGQDQVAAKTPDAPEQSPAPEHTAASPAPTIPAETRAEPPQIHYPALAASKAHHDAGHGLEMIYTVLCPKCGRQSSTRALGLHRCSCGQPITIQE